MFLKRFYLDINISFSREIRVESASVRDSQDNVSSENIS